MRQPETKWIDANLDQLFRMHLHRQPNTNTEFDLRSPINSTNYKTHKAYNNPYVCMNGQTVLLLSLLLTKTVNGSENRDAALTNRTRLCVPLKIYKIYLFWAPHRDF